MPQRYNIRQADNGFAQVRRHHAKCAKPTRKVSGLFPNSTKFRSGPSIAGPEYRQQQVLNMKTIWPPRKSALTLVELLFALASILIVVALLLPAMCRARSGGSVNCV